MSKSQPKSGRDKRGRWLPNHCPNIHGRGAKSRRKRADTSDIGVFKNTMIEVREGGKIRLMTREEALLLRRFQLAMNGSVLAARDVDKKFVEYDTRIAIIRDAYNQLLMEWIIDNPRRNDPNYEVPKSIDLHLKSLQAFLHAHFPNQYADPRDEDVNEGK